MHMFDWILHILFISFCTYCLLQKCFILLHVCFIVNKRFYCEQLYCEQHRAIVCKLEYWNANLNIGTIDQYV